MIIMEGGGGVQQLLPAAISGVHYVYIIFAPEKNLQAAHVLRST